MSRLVATRRRGTDEPTPQEGEVLVLLGPAGAGKSRLLSRLGETASARPTVEDASALGARPGLCHVGPRGLALPGTIYDNVALPLRSLAKPPLDLVDRVETALRQATLWDEVSERLLQPATLLSLGQRQRLALARALALEPRVLLLDDVAKACDLVTTQRLESSVRELCAQRILVCTTSDPVRARRLADRIAFVSGGNVLECADVEDLFARPTDTRTADFLGMPRGAR